MKRLFTIIFPGLFLLFCLSACIKDDVEEYEGANISVGDELPSLSLTMADGSRMSSNQLTGKVSVIILFTTTCPDCREQLPAVEDLYNAYRGDERVLIFGISRSEGNNSVREYWQKTGLTFPYSPQDDRTVYSQFAASGVPRIYISDEARIVRRIFTDNSLANRNELMSVVNSLLISE